MRTFWPIAILLLVGVLIWLGFERPEPRTGVAVIADPRPENALAQRTSPSSVPPVTSRPVPDPHDGQVEVCGLGWVDIATAEAQKDAAAAQIFAASRSGSQALITRLKQDSSPFVQSVGLIAQAFIEIEAQRVTRKAGTEPCEGPQCPETIVMSQVTDELARRANQSSDPRLYALAFSMCRPPTQIPACLSLSASQWARIDPENGAPWLFLAEPDATGKASAAIDEVLFQIAKAKRVDSRYFSVAAEISRHAGKDDSSILAASLTAIEAIGISAARSMAPFQYLTRACRDAALDDANRRQLCEGAAEALVTRSDSFLLALIGSGMGRRLGWDLARLDEFHGLAAASMDSLAAGQGIEGVSVSCAEASELLRRFDRQDEIGEVSHARQWLKENGKSQAEYSQKARENRLQAEAEETARKQAQAASAARRQPNGINPSKPN